jgi:hypothetical protein
MDKHPEDVRRSYIIPSTSGDVVQKKNGVEMYYIGKFSFQGGSPNLKLADHVPAGRNVPEQVQKPKLN